MIKNFFKSLLVVVVCIAVLVYLDYDEPSTANVQIPAKPSASSGIYVQDYAGVISAPVRKYLNELGRQLDEKTSAQLVVVTVKSLGGAPLEDYSLKLLRDWGIGNKEKNNGVLMLISTGDRKSRVEVGYGLEGALTDSLTGQIQDQYMIPYFRKGTYEPGIAYGYEALAQRVAREYNVQLAVSGYANHSPGLLKAGSGGQSTQELFDKALAEQNGTALPESTGKETPGKEPQGSGGVSSVAGTGNTKQDAGGETQAGASSAEGSVADKAKALGVFGLILYYGNVLVDTFGWIAIIIVLVFLDIFLFHGLFTELLFKILVFFFSGGGGGSGGGGYSGGGFGGGSGGGGGSSRSW